MDFWIGMSLGLSITLTAVSLAVFRRGYVGRAVLWLMGAALALRLALIAADPFLHDWDERFHALVAKNLLRYGRPLLRADPVLPYDYRLWCCNHVWLHKQPLFLWQMAGSMWLFGSNELALRLPSALLGSLLLWPVYRIGRLASTPALGYAAALLLAFASYQLELTTGWQGIDHADVAFGAYITASIWAYYESRQQPARAGWWSLLTGLLAGAAVLCKWLPGLLVYAPWMLDLLTRSASRRQPRAYARLTGAALVTLAVVLPWQLYIRRQFPLESAFEQQYAAQHFTQVLENQDGPWYYYFTHALWKQYQWLVLPLAAGLVLLSTPAYRLRPLRPLLVSCGLIFVFFSLAATKMPSYTYVVGPLLLVVVAVGWVAGLQWVGRRLTSWRARLAVGAGVLLLLFFDLQPLALLKHHTLAFASTTGRPGRQRKLQHTAVYRQLNQLVPVGYVIFNAPPLEEVEAMFYSNRNVYSWWPTAAEYRQLRARGLRVAAFPGPQPRPAYLRGPEVLPVPATLE